MRAGRLDRLITIQRKTLTQSASGDPVETWTNIALRRPSSAPAAVRPMKGDEMVRSPETIAGDEVEFKVRYSSGLADLSPLDRIIYPALAADQSETSVVVRRIYDILSVNELGRREGFSILANRRPDVFVTTTVAASLDFSEPDNSQFIPGLNT